jgi:YVTN family beta-propeller protein
LAGVTISLAIAVASFSAVEIAAADTIYVSNEKDNTITVVDGNSLTTVKTIPVGQRPRGIVLSKDQKSLYICASDSDRIEVLDLASNKVVRTLPSGADPEFFALDPTASCSTSPTKTTIS